MSRTAPEIRRCQLCISRQSNSRSDRLEGWGPIIMVLSERSFRFYLLGIFFVVAVWGMARLEEVRPDWETNEQSPAEIKSGVRQTFVGFWFRQPCIPRDRKGGKEHCGSTLESPRQTYPCAMTVTWAWSRKETRGLESQVFLSPELCTQLRRPSK